MFDNLGSLWSLWWAKNKGLTPCYVPRLSNMAQNRPKGNLTLGGVRFPGRTQVEKMAVDGAWKTLVNFFLAGLIPTCDSSQIWFGSDE